MRGTGIEETLFQRLFDKRGRFFHPRYSSIITAERMIEQGFTTSFPAMLGAVHESLQKWRAPSCS